MSKRSPKTFTSYTDDAGGRITYNSLDGYLAWLDAHCIGEVINVDEGILVISDYRTRERARATEPAPRCELCGEPAVLVGEQWVCEGCGPSSEPGPCCERCGYPVDPAVAVLAGEQMVCPACTPEPTPPAAHNPPAQVHFFYDWSGELSDDGEGGLVQLCASCARLHADSVQKASRGDDQSACELCRASNDPAYSISLDAIIGRLTARAA